MQNKKNPKKDSELKKIFSQLNPEQLDAVNSTEGPVMVIAGPGTGKTQILAGRIANILEKGLADSQNILCLTYTDAGVVAMRKRLLKFIGTESYNVNIHTFHSFCNEIIQENLDYFQKRELKLVSDLDQKIIIEKIILDLEIGNPLYKKPGTDLDFEISRLGNLFSVMKSEDWTSEDIKKAIEIYKKDLPNRDGFVYKRKFKDKKAGDLNPKYFAEIEKMDMISAGSELFDKYQKYLEENNSFDYQDMILWVINAFKDEKNPDILAKYQEKYQYILVDEFQDTNGSQNEIVSLLTDFWDEPNIFVVGDDDQSIFRFQGANLRNIMDFYLKHKNSVKNIVLEKNYRSSQEILDVAKSSIEFNTERVANEIGLEKNFYAANEKVKNLKGNVKISEYFNNIHEEVGIVKKIEELQKKGEKLSDIAVIYRNHSQVENIKKILEAKKIPLNIKQKINILDEIFIKNIIKILDYINGEFKNPGSKKNLLFEVLHCDFFDFEIKKIFEIYNDDENFSETEIGKKFQEAIKNTQNKSLIHQAEFIFSEFGILNYVLKSEEKNFLMRLITTFFNFIKEESQKNPNIGIGEILEILEKMKKYRVPLEISKINFSKDGVIFTTAHSSKGLEFKHVFLIGLESKKWEKAKKMATNFSLPDSLTLSNEGNEEEELRRLFFVALTRAKEHLELSFSGKDLSENEIIPSKFLAEITQQNPDLKTEKIALEDDVIQDYYSLIFQSVNSDFGIIEKEEVNKILENFSLSVSSMNTYLRCPVQFYFEKILRIPSAENSAMAFGNAVHYALEYFLKNGKSNGKFGDFELLKKFFEKGLFLKKNIFGDEEYKKFLKFGENILKKFYDFKKFDLKSSAEKNIYSNLGEIKINGKIDRIDFFEDGSLKIVDYKTGKFRKPKFQAGQKDFEIGNFDKNEIKKLGGDYWRQAVFYKILCENDAILKNKKISQIGFEFIEDEENFEKILEIGEDDVEIVKKQIQDVWHKINTHQFYVGCEDEKCKWCEFKNGLEK